MECGRRVLGTWIMVFAISLDSRESIQQKARVVERFPDLVVGEISWCWGNSC